MTVTIDSASGRVGTLGTLGAAIGYIDESIQGKLFGPKLISFNGVVVAGWYPRQAVQGNNQAQPITVGNIRVRIIGGTSEQPKGINGAEGASSASVATALATARLHVDGGEVASEATFSITVRGYIGEIFPARLDIVAPSRGSSDIGEFTILRRPEADFSSVPSVSSDETPAVLIDISQSGTTVQLLEFALPSAPSSPRQQP